MKVMTFFSNFCVLDIRHPERRNICIQYVWHSLLQCLQVDMSLWSRCVEYYTAHFISANLRIAELDTCCAQIILIHV
jgi:hypothetical protein